MKKLKDRIEHSLNLLRAVDEQYDRPLVLCSFGKDSMVMLHLIRQLRFKWDVAFHRFATNSRKYSFAEEIINSWNLKVFPMDPIRRSVIAGNGKVDVVSHYSTGSTEYLVPIANLVESDSEGSDYCGLDDLLSENLKQSKSEFPYDICLAGVKICDVDPVIGQISCDSDFKKQKGAADFAFPIRYWRDEDIFQFTISENIPFQGTRYIWGPNKKFGEHKDKTFNPDYLNCCTRCINPYGSSNVWCPKLQKMVLNRNYEDRDLMLSPSKIYLA